MNACHFLKTITSEYHRKVERTLVNQLLLSKTLSLTSYASCMGHYLGLINPLEKCLVSYPTIIVCGYSFRSQWLKDDLLALGWSQCQIEDHPQYTQLPTVDTLAKALGVAYVLQGSQLGGVVLRKQITATLGEDILRCNGLNFWGVQSLDDVTSSWQAFKSNVDELFSTRHDLSLSETAQAATETFACFHYWFNQPLANY